MPLLRPRLSDGRIAVARVAMGIAALLTVGIAARAGGVAAVPRTAWQPAWLTGELSVVLLVVAGVAAVAFVVLVGLLARGSRGRGERLPQLVVVPVGSRFGRLAAALVALAVMAVPVGVLVASHHVGSSGAGRTAAPPRPGVAASSTPKPAAEASRPGSGGNDGEPAGVVVLVVVGMAAAVAGATGLLHRHRRATPVPDPHPAASAEDGGVADALLRHPGRLLRRAGDRQLIDPGDGQALVARFERARFSPHQVTAADQVAAERALAAVLARLGAGIPPTIMIGEKAAELIAEEHGSA